MKRVQRKRVKGWRMPPNTVYVGRASWWGNPFPLSAYSRDESLRRFREMLEGKSPEELDEIFKLLRGKDLACWCPLDKRCHADILLEFLEK